MNVVKSFLKENKIVIALSLTFTGVVALVFFTNIFSSYWAGYFLDYLTYMYLPLLFLINFLHIPFGLAEAVSNVLTLIGSFLYMFALLWVIKKVYTKTYINTYVSYTLRFLVIAWLITGIFFVMIQDRYQTSDETFELKDHLNDKTELVTELNIVEDNKVRFGYAFLNNLSTDI